MNSVEKDALDKIRAEILEESEAAYADFEQYKVDYLGVDAEYVEDELPQDDFRYGMKRALEIIDKYKENATCDICKTPCIMYEKGIRGCKNITL